MATPQVLAVIPARYASTRFPGKPLTMISGKPLLQWVWEAARHSKKISQVLVATDDSRIASAAQGFGAKVKMTRLDHPSGTDRVAEAALGNEADWILNLQGDEPLLTGASLDTFLGGLLPHFGMATMATPLASMEDLNRRDVVKVAWDAGGQALGFRRLGIPASAKEWCHQHVGIYVYRPEILQRFVKLPPSEGELREKLEQLRALENGIAIQVLPLNFESVGVDTPGDVPRAERALANRATSVSI